MENPINERTGQPYYAGSADNIKSLTTVLGLDGGRLSRITPEKIYYYMNLAEEYIDGYLEEYYFTPILQKSQWFPNNVTKLVFPVRIVRCAQYLAAGLMLQSEFQALEPNANESVQTYINDSKKELYMMTIYNTRLQGQTIKNALHTAPPSMMPAMPPNDSMFT